MIEQTLTVVKTKGRLAYLQAPEKKACAGCNGRCGAMTFAKLFGERKRLLPYQFDSELSPGQQVLMRLDDSHIAAHSLLVYLMPLLGFFIGLFAASQQPEWLQLASGLLLGGLGFGLAKRRLYRQDYSIEVVKIYPISMAITQIDGDCSQ